MFRFPLITGLLLISISSVCAISLCREFVSPPNKNPCRHNSIVSTQTCEHCCEDVEGSHEVDWNSVKCDCLHEDSRVTLCRNDDQGSVSEFSDRSEDEIPCCEGGTPCNVM
mmetsp:Transcript_19529/g.31684  ORF Transcript_19529/g.31684 Transcript_19529/m.31684 type:complete len:111 (+) Transcript_19529:69-401(+)